ncbi:MAG: cysteine desulfurase [Deferribacterales bacterium]|nr:cysteine desulfurase [Deferribacterales bacterium]
MAIYFDNSATTRVDPVVRDAMIPFFSDRYGNPSSIHSVGRDVREDVTNARQLVADLIKATPDEIIYTGSGSESDNLAIIQTARAFKDKGRHIITSSIEHKAVLETCKFLESEGFEVTYLPVDNKGVVDMDAFKSALRDDTILVSIMLANNEIGTVQPVKEIAEIASKKGVIVHTDAVQAVGKMHIDVNDLGVHMLTFSGHKIYAPKGIGILYVDIELREKLKPLIHGGQQEGGLRAGTENVPYIIGLGKACEILLNTLDKEIRHIKSVRDRFEKRVLEEIPHTYINGHPTKRVPSISDVTFKFIEGEALMVYAQEICCSAGSACTSSSVNPSHVLTAINIDLVDCHGALRFSFGRFNTIEEADRAVDILKVAVEKLRMMSPLYCRK